MSNTNYGFSADFCSISQGPSHCTLKKICSFMFLTIVTGHCMTEQSKLNLGTRGSEWRKEQSVTDAVGDPSVSPGHSLPGFPVSGGLRTASLVLLWLLEHH